MACAAGRAVLGDRLLDALQLRMKPSLRMQLQAYLAGLDAGTVRQHSLAVAQRLATVPAFTTAQTLAVFVSFGKEIETHAVIRQLLARGRQICVPAFHAGKYVAAAIEDFDQNLVAGKLGILEPKQLHHVPVTRPDVWLVPGLAFDRRGNRLGRGKGYFDALLQHATGVKIALAHDFQLLDEVPTEPHDIHMDLIVTEKQVVHCHKES